MRRRLGAAAAAFCVSAALLTFCGGGLGCQEVPHYRGTMADASVGWTLAQSADSSCQCCALCHQRPTCASLSFQSSNGDCRLFDQVASHASFQRSPSSELAPPLYYLMPGRSERGQFCRDDRDCKDPDLSCTAYVCTDDPTVTCRDIAAEVGSTALDDVYWGAVRGETMLFFCWNRGAWGPGYTLLVSNAQDSVGWNDNTFKNRPGLTERPDFGQLAYSVLGQAKHIRDSADNATFRVGMVGAARYLDGDDRLIGIEMTLKRSTVLISGSPQNESLIVARRPYADRPFTISGHCTDSSNNRVAIEGKMTVPFLYGVKYLLTINRAPKFDPPGRWDYGTLITNNGVLRWNFREGHCDTKPDYVQFFIRE